MAQAQYRGGLNFQQVNQVRRLVAAGHTVEAVAKSMLVTVECVQSHVGSVKKKRKSPTKKPKAVASSAPDVTPEERGPDDDDQTPILGGGETIPDEG